MWFAITIAFIVLVAFGIRLFLTRKRKHDANAPASSVSKKKMKKIEVNVSASKKVKKGTQTLEDTPSETFNPTKALSKRTLAYWQSWYIEKYHPGRAILINMELTNGFHRSFTIKEKEEGFIFRGKKYLFDDEHKYYNIDAKLYAFDYHEGLALPIKRKIPLTAIKKTLESTEEIDIEYAINPATLQRFMTAKIAEGVMKGTQLDEFMRKLQMFLIVTMIAVLVHLALFLYASGMLQNIKVPGLIG